MALRTRLNEDSDSQTDSEVPELEDAEPLSCFEDSEDDEENVQKGAKPPTVVDLVTSSEDEDQQPKQESLDADDVEQLMMNSTPNAANVALSAAPIAKPPAQRAAP